MKFNQFDLYGNDVLLKVNDIHSETKQEDKKISLNVIAYDMLCVYVVSVYV